MVAVRWQSPPQHVTHDLHQVKGRMHGSQEALPRLFGNIDDVCASLTCEHTGATKRITQRGDGTVFFLMEVLG